MTRMSREYKANSTGPDLQRQPRTENSQASHTQSSPSMFPSPTSNSPDWPETTLGAFESGAGEAEAAAEALKIPAARAALGGKEPRRVVYVPGKIINFVA